MVYKCPVGINLEVLTTLLVKYISRSFWSFRNENRNDYDNKIIVIKKVIKNSMVTVEETSLIIKGLYYT